LVQEGLRVSSPGGSFVSRQVKYTSPQAPLPWIYLTFWAEILQFCHIGPSREKTEGEEG